LSGSQTICDDVGKDDGILELFWVASIKDLRGAKAEWLKKQTRYKREGGSIWILQTCEFSITRQDVRSRNVLVLNREEVDKVRRRHSN
jgi:hypothetical protein